MAHVLCGDPSGRPSRLLYFPMDRTPKKAHPQNCLEVFGKPPGHNSNMRESVLKHKRYRAPGNETQVRRPQTLVHPLAWAGELGKTSPPSRTKLDHGVGDSGDNLCPLPIAC